MQKRGPQSGGRRRAKRPITAPLSWERRETASDPCSEHPAFAFLSSAFSTVFSLWPHFYLISPCVWLLSPSQPGPTCSPI